jgi:hypothetical protein
MQELTFQPGLKILVACHTEEIELDKLHHTTVRTPAAVELQEQRRDECQVNFNRLRRGRIPPASGGSPKCI